MAGAEIDGSIFTLARSASRAAAMDKASGLSSVTTLSVELTSSILAKYAYFLFRARLSLQENHQTLIH